MHKKPTLSVESLIKDYVLGSFHQGDKRFDGTAGIHCVCMTLTALCWSNFRKVLIRRASDLDFLYSKVETEFAKLREIWFTFC